MIRILASACAASIVTGVALAQTTPPVPPIGPTKVECDRGYQAGSQWTQDQFTKACDKLRQGQGQ
jgi:hypothetical protein